MGARSGIFVPGRARSRCVASEIMRDAGNIDVGKISEELLFIDQLRSSVTALSQCTFIWKEPILDMCPPIFLKDIGISVEIR
ncbi:hypothetical protein TNCV_3718921 [Trichonephila clavipes]|nr:hypothetical protein TNCV_3718921 [Trichonephila clavipes]